MSPSAAAMFDQAVRLPQVPQVLREVIKSLRDDRVSAQQLANLVSQDQVVAAKVLRLANSAYYGAPGRVSSVKEAVQMLGLDTFRNLVISSSLAGAFPKVDGFDLHTFWRNSMLVANLAHLIGRDLDGDRELLFSAGLMHSIGQLLICLCLPAQAAALVDIVWNADIGTQRAAEQARLQLDHFEVGMELARRWNFPESIQAAVGHYDDTETDDRVTQVVHAAVCIARGIQAEDTFAQMQEAIPPRIAESLHLDRDWFMESGEVFELLQDEADALA